MFKTIKEIDEQIANGPYKDNWQSLQSKSIPEWFKKDKFGIFIHWGLYSLAAFNNEWYPRNMYIEGSKEFEHHIKTFGKHKEFGYKDFIPLFKAEEFNAKEWITSIKNSGAKYFVQVAEHHEGYQMYQSDISKWNTFEMGPKKDILLELRNESKTQGLKFGASSHRAEHWFFLGHGKKFDSDIELNQVKGDFYWPSEEEFDSYDFSSKKAPSKEFLEDWLLRTIEIIDKINPDILYFDWWIQHEVFKPYLKKVVAYYYNHAHINNMEVAICYKHDALAYGTGIKEIERGRFKDIKHFPWQTETSIANNSWAYTNDQHYKSLNEIITLLIDVVSKNGNLLLNVGPKGSGKIPEYEENILKEVGTWLDVNGEAIYNSLAYEVFGEGPTIETEGMFSEQSFEYTNKDYRFTVANGSVYVFILNPKDTLEFKIKTLSKGIPSDHTGIFSNIENITLLGSNEIIKYEHTSESLNIKLSSNNYDKPIVFKVSME